MLHYSFIDIVINDRLSCSDWTADAVLAKLEKEDEALRALKKSLQAELDACRDDPASREKFNILDEKLDIASGLLQTVLMMKRDVYDSIGAHSLAICMSSV